VGPFAAWSGWRPRAPGRVRKVERAPLYAGAWPWQTCPMIEDAVPPPTPSAFVPSWAFGSANCREAAGKWQAEAACRHLPTDLFFPVGRGARARAQTRLAKEICQACAVRSQCLAHALVSNARYGVFGGLAEEERREVLAGDGSGADDSQAEGTAEEIDLVVQEAFADVGPASDVGDARQR
jgi:WhiB family transcriptional regulator, redox-sensing transcriptional regulator